MHRVIAMSMLGGGRFSTADVRFEPGEAAGEADRLVATLREVVLGRLRRRGGVVWLSGAVESAVVAALCERAFGRGRVLGLFMTDAETPPEQVRRARQLAAHLRIRTADEPLTPALAAIGCYRRRDAAIRTVVPEFGEGWSCTITVPNVFDNDLLRLFTLVVRAPDGTERSVELSLETYLEISAATGFKQRIRKSIEYFHADRSRYAVVGTTNLLEYDQGLFVKHGDGAADVKPIAHLYTTQILQLAEQLGLPDELRVSSRPRALDERALGCEQMDACLYARDRGIPAGEVAEVLGLSVDQVERVFHDIDAKRAAARYLHARPILFGGGR